MAKISREIIDEIVNVASKTAIGVYKKEHEKAVKQEMSNRFKKTKEQLKAYRKIKKKIEQDKSFSEQQKSEYRWQFVEDLMGSEKEIFSRSERVIQDEEKKRQEDLYAMYRIENALKLYKEEVDLTANEEEKRRYRVLNSMYISSKGPYTVQEIAKQENISEKSVYRDIGLAVKIVSIYLYGV